jgi:poly-gamma-glutamate synthesis protein (capsule biosynthesis protein)
MPPEHTPGDLVLCLTGDVMLGRGIDQILGHPGDPRIYEEWAGSALAYVDLAEAHSGPIPRRVAPPYVWGDALATLHERAPDATIVNLETAVTDVGEPWPGKGIQYRMHPANASVLTEAGIDVAVLANNHVLDWSVPGLEQTLDVLAGEGIQVAGAGRTADEAWAPATLATPRARVVVLGVGSTTSGIPTAWAAGERRPGVALLADLSQETVDEVAATVRASTRPGDVVVVSIHWGPNWGYHIPQQRRRFAQGLIDRAGVHVVHGHSSHHPLGVEVYAGHLIVHGCGDLLTDYEGISGHRHYRGDLGGLYFATIDPATGTITRLEIVPTMVEGFRLVRPSPTDVEWLADVLDTQGTELGTSVSVDAADNLVVGW